MVYVDAVSADVLLRVMDCFVFVTQTCEKHKQFF